MLQIIQKQLDESVQCPLCRASMYWVEAEQYDIPVHFHECSHCKHQIYAENQYNCHCEQCTSKRKKLLRETRLQETRKSKRSISTEIELSKLSFIHKLFLLSLLDDSVQEHTTYPEFIDWDVYKYQAISPNYLYQSHLMKSLIHDHILISKDHDNQSHQYYLNVRLDGYGEPSIFSITQQLRHWFYKNLTLGVPFKSAEEVKDALYHLLYQEIIQFMQFYCRMWKINIAGNKSFQIFCFRLLDVLALGQIYYLIQNALEYLYQQKVLQPRNENFINTNLLKKTLAQYRTKSLAEKWETFILPRPYNLPLSKMSQILFFHFLGYDETIFVQPLTRVWKKIEPRLKFYSTKRCMHCGSTNLSIDYDAGNYVSLFCDDCKHQDHYFTQ
ncbi:MULTISPECIES: hypothetical protein [unclassified Acinetobacter]|uniref:hypothetical protein n=1 Tax=unclassified Acinetobacter TaxID=196816 RepID=UPI002934894D|nr:MULTISPECIES: hypothetical protein [unclassified Acinetobacter]WOE33061.1 hypothetical protein QSG84_02510 [Acinetobacter sp. SAAs470]WOE39892.1 hypothetical protein QSG86_11555 [Acinetobacter sp. SAAs474]